MAALNVVVLAAVFVVFAGPRVWGEPVDASVIAEKSDDIEGTESSDPNPQEESKVLSDEEIDEFLTGTAGKDTNIAQAIKDAVNSTGDSRIAAIVLISDGQHNASDEKPVDALPTDVPVFTVGVGDPSEPRNLEVVRLIANDQVVKDDPFEIEATVRAIGLDSSDPVDVVLYRAKAGATEGGADPEMNEEDKWEEIGRNRVTFPPTGGEKAVEPFKVKEESPGQFTYRVSIAELKDETDNTDNAKTANVTVLNDKARVLLISGGPSWDYRMVQNLLTNDDRFDLSCWLQSMDGKMQQKGNTPIRQLPITPAELSQYHVIMLFDPNPEIEGLGALEFNEEWIDALTQWADEHGGGLLFVAGPQYTDRFLSNPETRGIQKMLPVYIADTDAIESRLVSTYSRPWPLRVEPSNADHAIMRFAGEGNDDIDVWNQMPGVFWSFPAESAKPGARALIEHGDPDLQIGQHHRPLLVVNKFGAGRTVYLGFNGTWRWRRLFGAEYFRRFWIQLTKYLVEGRNLRGKNRVIVDVDRRSYDIGDTVNVFARLLQPNFEPLDAPKVVATLRGGTLPPEEVELTMVEPGEYKGSITDISRLSVNTLSLPLEGTGEKVETTFTVNLPAIEKKDLRLNQPLLEELARESEGGQYFAVSDASEIAGLIKDRSKTTLVPGKPIELWDTYFLLFTLAGLLSVEWMIRKRFKLA
ncbi:MAG: VWA domain-containing protein, partial [Pirellulales bacterium]|nr:VWA domain-containing protein [Pirellulales bacterium]